MNILITGITGYFGAHLAQEFSGLGKIHGLKRPNSNLDLLQKATFPIVWHEGDIADLDSLMDAMSGIDLVVHAAGMVSFATKDEDQLYQVNSLGTAQVVNAMLSTGVKRLVHISSVSAIGRTTEVKEYNEDFKWIDSPLNSGYAISKYWAELEVWRGEQEGLEPIVVNPSVLLGKTNYPKSSGTLYNYLLQEPIFYPKGSLNYIDIRDAARITRLLVEKNAWGERFILNKESQSYQHFFTQVAKALGVKAPRIPVSNGMLKLFLPFLSLFKWIGLSKSQLSSQMAKNSQMKINYSNSKIQAFLDFKYRSLEETLDWAKMP